MALPPTTVTPALPQTHRANLIRTTRKLEALLGETPLVVEAAGGHSRTSSLSSVGSTDSKRSGRYFAAPSPRGPSLAPPSTERPTLLLRRPAPRPLSGISLASPLSPAFPRSPPLSPLSPLTPPPPRAVDRRKKMAKLVRTLGTNVPPQLVFAGSAAVVPAILTALAPQHGVPAPAAKRRRRASYSADADADDAASLASATREAVAAFPWPPAHPDEDADADWVAVAVPASTSASAPASPAAAAFPPAAARADAPFAQAGAAGAWACTDARSTHRREQGWSGEWSGAGARGMEDVVSRLRGLRVK